MMIRPSRGEGAAFVELSESPSRMAPSPRERSSEVSPKSRVAMAHRQQQRSPRCWNPGCNRVAIANGVCAFANAAREAFDLPPNNKRQPGSSTATYPQRQERRRPQE